ncbi:MAG TPA: hypothetical protein VF092_22160 [Longimicrobium sp.]
MFGLEILDVILGLAFVYLLLSLICSAINEYIAGLTNRRGKILIAGIEKLLDDAQDPNLKNAVLNHRLIRCLYGHDRRGAERAPSYIPARTFAMALLDVVENTPEPAAKAAAAEADGAPAAGPARDAPQSVRDLLHLMKDDALTDVVQQISTEVDEVVDAAPLPAGARRAVQSAVATTRTDLQKLHDSVEVWFNNSMDRVSGAYKRHTQQVLFVLGLITAFALNADTLDMWNRLSTDDKLRESVATQASNSLEDLANFVPGRGANGSTTDSTVASSNAGAPNGGGGNAAVPGDSGKAATTDSTTTDSTAATDSSATTDSSDANAPAATGDSTDSAKAVGTENTPASPETRAQTDSLADLAHARALYDSANAILRRTQLGFGWGWEDAEKLGFARRMPADRAKARRNSIVAAEFAKLNGRATHADSARIAATPLPVYEASPGGWKFWPILAKLLGILLTAFALSLGAPFWFDTLNKIINIRSAGRAPDEKAKSPEAAGKRLAEQPTK